MISTYTFSKLLQIDHIDDQFPIFNLKEWKSFEMNQFDKLKEDDFQVTVNKIIEIGIASLSELELKKFEHIISNFNRAWTVLRMKLKKISSQDIFDNKPILFNSYNKINSWLSNFFPTLIVDIDYRLIYRSLEHGYVCFKARKAALNNLSEEITYINMLPTAKEAKQVGSSLWNRKNDSDNEIACGEMMRLIHLKYTQNLVLNDLLKKTRPSELQEHTSDEFWGTCYGAIINENSNHLGKIIMEYRNINNK